MHASVRACVYACARALARVNTYASANACVSFNQVEVALSTYCHSLFHAPFNNLNSIHNCLLCANPGNVSPLVNIHDINI